MIARALPQQKKEAWVNAFAFNRLTVQGEDVSVKI
jgi:hypothetical protein